jgi:hypothetical protein
MRQADELFFFLLFRYLAPRILGIRSGPVRYGRTKDLRHTKVVYASSTDVYLPPRRAFIVSRSPVELRRSTFRVTKIYGSERFVLNFFLSNLPVQISGGIASLTSSVLGTLRYVILNPPPSSLPRLGTSQGSHL